VVFSKTAGFSFTILEKVKTDITNEYEDEGGAIVM